MRVVDVPDVMVFGNKNMLARLSLFGPDGSPMDDLEDTGKRYNTWAGGDVVKNSVNTESAAGGLGGLFGGSGLFASALSTVKGCKEPEPVAKDSKTGDILDIDDEHYAQTATTSSPRGFSGLTLDSQRD